MPSGLINSQSIFATSFTAQAISTAGVWDVFGIQAGANDKLAIHACNLSILSTGTPSGQTGVQLFRGSTASSTSGAATSVNLRAPQADGSTDPTSNMLPSSSPVSTASASLLFSDSFSANWAQRLPGIDQVPLSFVDPGQRLHVRLNGSLTAIDVLSEVTK